VTLGREGLSLADCCADRESLLSFRLQALVVLLLLFEDSLVTTAGHKSDAGAYPAAWHNRRRDTIQSWVTHAHCRPQELHSAAHLDHVLPMAAPPLFAS
jgi:hypothetical protein